MQLHIFYGTYANTPLADRGKVLDFMNESNLTLSGIYQRLKEIGDLTRPMEIERDHLLRVADEYYRRKNEKENR